MRDIHELLGDPLEMIRMERAARSLARPEAAARIADLVEEMVARG